MPLAEDADPLLSSTQVEQYADSGMSRKLSLTYVAWEMKWFNGYSGNENSSAIIAKSSDVNYLIFIFQNKVTLENAWQSSLK